MVILLSMRTGTGMDFFYSLALPELMENIKAVSEVLKEERQHGGKKQ